MQDLKNPKSIAEEFWYQDPIQALKMHMDSSQGHVYPRTYNENAAEQMEHPDIADSLVRACPVEMHMDISEKKTFMGEFTMKKTAPQRAYLDHLHLTPGKNTFRKNPWQCGHTGGKSS